MKKKDYSNLNADHLPNFSGNWNNDLNAGTFYLNVNNSASNTNANISGHLKFSKKKYISLKSERVLYILLVFAVPLGKTYILHSCKEI